MTSFEYNPIALEGPAFRLLRLLKGDDNPIQCELFESKLPPPESVRDYAALSYTWGSTSRPCEIMINGSKMSVTKNAYLALRDLRYQEKDRILWIDALCINQKNDQERGRQVQQMGSIYSEAERVIVWLGEATYDTDYVMHHMKQLEKEGIKHASNDQEISDKQWVDVWSAMVHNLSADQRDLLVEGLQSLLCRKWFKRVWIIQEIANARVAEITCGSKSVSASIFTLMPILLKVTPDRRCQPILDIMPGPHRDSSWWVKKRNLHTMLIKFCKSKATDPRDNIYALLNISSDACDTDLLKADYAKHLQDIIFDTTLFLLNFNKLDSPIRCFFNWTLREFFRNLNSLANEVLKCAMNTGHEALVKLLIVRDDVDVNIRLGVAGQTPLLWAAELGHEAVVKLLLETGKVDVDSKDTTFHSTPLSWAAREGHEAIVKLLLKTGKVDVDSKTTEFDWTPLFSAAERGHEAIVKLLLETGKVNVNSKATAFHRTPLLQAAREGHEAVVKLLLETGKVDENSKDTHGHTALSYAVERGHEAVVKLLLEMGKAHGGLKEALSYTVAVERGHDAVVKLLQSFTAT